MFAKFYLISAILVILSCAEGGEVAADHLFHDNVVPDCVDQFVEQAEPPIEEAPVEGVLPELDEADAGGADGPESSPEVVDILDLIPSDLPPEDTVVDIGPGTCRVADFVRQVQCNDGYKCTVGAIIGCAPIAHCDVAGTQGDNQPCTPLDLHDNCREGFVCLDDGAEHRCRKFCFSDADCFGTNAGCIISLISETCPTGLTGVGACSYNCDYFYQSGCQPGQACRFLVDYGSRRIYSDCSFAGAGRQWDPCRSPTDCAAGYDCFVVGSGASMCLQICNSSGWYPSCFIGTCVKAPDWPGNIGACL